MYWDCFPGHKDRVHHHCELNFDVKGVLLIDEGDAVMFTEALHFYDNYSSKEITIVCFTATPYDTSKDGMDKKLLDELEFDILY